MTRPLTRRERQRAQTINEIKEAARQQMAESGSANLSLSAVARAMGLSTPALYYYYPDRDALLTALIVDAFNGLADAMEAAAVPIAPHAYADRLYRALLAYREWAIAHPADFQLIYGTPLPGYHAPAETTVPAARRGFALILRTLQQAHDAGMLRPHPAQAALPDDVRFTVAPLDGATVALDVANIAIIGWTRLHGVIMLELFHHLQPNLQGIDSFYREQVRILLAEVGLTPS